MFEHSVKVPRLYKTAAKIAERVKLHGESVKQVYDDKLKHRNIKALYALIVSTVQNDTNLEILLKKSELLRKETRLEPWLAKVLITELLWGKKRLSGDSKPIQTILAYQQIFNAHLNEIEEQPRNSKDKVDKPRYVRVNTLKISVIEAVDAFRDEGWTLVQFLDKDDYPGFLDKILNLEEYEFMVDIHVPYLLIFPPRTEFFTHNAYKDGHIALQDKASCLPAHILNPSPGCKVLDMCAAPGMKTTQMASIMNGSGTIYAVERDLKRASVLRGMIEASGAQDCVQVVDRDVLDVCKRKGGLVLDSTNDGKFKEYNATDETVDQKDADDVYRVVDFILIDPSCSGSGMVEGPEKIGNFRTDQSRLKKLAGFQIMILKHALRAFPSAKRVVYSTCSVNIEENEEVVKEVLQSTQHFRLVDVKTLVSPWVHFGSDSYGDIGSYCLYSRPDEDLTNGFFVAVFDRLESGEENKFLLKREQYTGRFLKNEFSYSKNLKNENDALEDESLQEVDEVNQHNNNETKTNQKQDPQINKWEFWNDMKRSKTQVLQDSSLQNTNEVNTIENARLAIENQSINESADNVADNDNSITSKRKKKEEVNTIENTRLAIENQSINESVDNVADNDNGITSKRKKKKEVNTSENTRLAIENQSINESVDNVADNDNGITSKRKKKKEVNTSENTRLAIENQSINESVDIVADNDNGITSKRKKKKEVNTSENTRLAIENQSINESVENVADNDNGITSKRKKKKEVNTIENTKLARENQSINENVNNAADNDNGITSKRKKKKEVNTIENTKLAIENQSINESVDNVADNDNGITSKRKKKKEVNTIENTKLAIENQSINESVDNVADNDNGIISKRKKNKNRTQQNFQLKLKNDMIHSNDDEIRAIEITESNKKKKGENLVIFKVDQQLQMKDKKKKKIAHGTQEKLEEIQNSPQNGDRTRNTKKSRETLQNCEDEHVHNESNSSASNKKKIKKGKCRVEQQTVKNISAEDQIHEENTICDIAAITDESFAIKKRKKLNIKNSDKDEVAVHNTDLYSTEKKKYKKRTFEKSKHVEDHLDDHMACSKRNKKEKS